MAVVKAFPGLAKSLLFVPLQQGLLALAAGEEAELQTLAALLPLPPFGLAAQEEAATATLKEALLVTAGGRPGGKASAARTVVGRFE